MWSLLALLSCAGVTLLSVEAGLTLSKKCGEKVCGEQEYCSEYDRTCQPCESVCDLGSHNYQEEMCQKDCQDYLHNRLYLKRNEQPLEDLQDEFANLQVKVNILLSLLVVLIAIVVIIYPLFWYLKVRSKRSGLAGKIRKKIESINALQGNNNIKEKDVESDAQKVVYKIGLDMNLPSAQPVLQVAPVASSPTRYPAEDNTLEYGGYDNPGLTSTPSPIFNKTDPLAVNKRESSF